MDFSWSTEQDELHQRTLAFARTLRVAPDAGFAAAPWKACGEFGLLGLCAPEPHGMGASALATARALEAFGQGCEDTGLAFSIAAHLFACVVPIVHHGSERLRTRLLPALCDGGGVGANAISEPNAGSDVFALATRAVRDGDHYILDGTKSYVTNGSVADCFIVYAKTDPAAGFLGVTAFVVEKGMPGLTVGQPFVAMGLTTSGTSSIYLEACRVPVDNRLGDEGQGAYVFESAMTWERACLFGIYLGVMERQLERCIDYAKTRRQGGKSIGKHQAIAHKIADMKLRLESARLLLYRACWMIDRGDDATVASALAKIAVSEAAVASGLDAIQIHGAIGIVREAGIERDLRDAIPSRIFSGTSEVQRNVIASRLGL